MFGSDSLTSMSSIRPPMLAGPMMRNRNDDNAGLEERLVTCCADAADSASGRDAANPRRLIRLMRGMTLDEKGVSPDTLATRELARLLGKKKRGRSGERPRSSTIQGSY